MIPRVCVLLSTYNGEKYVKQLIESVLSQINVQVKLFIRDDGSEDLTVRIIEEFNDTRITCHFGKNIGVTRSFLELVRMAPQADFYAFCDQDDVWYTDKLWRAVSALQGRAPHAPALYMSNVDVVDSELNFLHKMNMHFEKSIH